MTLSAAFRSTEASIVSLTGKTFSAKNAYPLLSDARHPFSLTGFDGHFDTDAAFGHFYIEVAVALRAVQGAGNQRVHRISAFGARNPLQSRIEDGFFADLVLDHRHKRAARVSRWPRR